MDKFKFFSKNKIEQLPKTSGVYLLASPKPNGEGGFEIIYIGKAINIKNRVKNHFQQPNYKDNLFVNKITKIGFIETDSEIEALILEANLIKKYQPKFNVIWKDDKNYFYVAVTQPLPVRQKANGVGASKKSPSIVYITHQPSFAYKLRTGKQNEKAEYIGPFVEGTALKKTLRFLRKALPYYTARRHPKNNCTYCHLGLCPGPNPDFVEYKKNIKKLILILKGKKNNVLNSLKKEMRQLSFKKEFEKAAKIRDRIYNLQQIMNHTRVIEFEKIETESWDKTEKILRKIIKIDKTISRVEAYDISNIQGTQATGSMVVFVNGKPDKNLYRKFKIKISEKPNDIAMLKETLERRFTHLEWKLPELILIDGGTAQLNIGIKVKNGIRENPSSRAKLTTGQAKKIKVISIAKRYKELFIEGIKKPILLKTLPQEIFNLIISLDDEAHRFAITYHKKLRKKYLLK